MKVLRPAAGHHNLLNEANAVLYVMGMSFDEAMLIQGRVVAYCLSYTCNSMAVLSSRVRRHVCQHSNCEYVQSESRMPTPEGTPLFETIQQVTCQKAAPIPPHTLDFGWVERMQHQPAVLQIHVLPR